MRANGTLDVEHEGQRYNVKVTKVTAVVRPPVSVTGDGPPILPDPGSRWDHWKNADVGEMQKNSMGDYKGRFKVGNRAFTTSFELGAETSSFFKQGEGVD